MSSVRGRSWLGLEVLLLTAIAVTGVSGCTAIADLNRFKVVADAGQDAGSKKTDAATDAGNDAGAPIGCDNPATLCVRLVNFDKYDGHLVVLDLAADDETLRSRVYLDPAQKVAMQDVVLPLAVPASEVPDKLSEHPLHVEIWADKDDDRKYSADKDDGFLVGLSQVSHAIADAKQLTVTALTPQPTAIGGDFTITLSGFNIHVGRMLELMVIERATGRTAGMYRLLHVPKVDAMGSFDITLPGVINPKLSYDIEFYADADGSSGDHKYDGLFDDHSWVLRNRAGTKTGLHIIRKHTEDKTDPDAPFRPLTYQFPFKD